MHIVLYNRAILILGECHRPALLILGPSDAGKSTLQDNITALVGAGTRVNGTYTYMNLKTITELQFLTRYHRSWTPETEKLKLTFENGARQLFKLTIK